MRLLDTRTLRLKEVTSETSVQYAILSHVWGKEEVTFEDMNASEFPVHKLGFSKVHGACQRARADELMYIWIDTCCIDKSSSSELSEAINSMYRYYQSADVCYAYLADISTSVCESRDLSSSRWFTRGWTLQELIAPHKLIFISSSWQVIGNRAEMAEHVSEITGITKPVLLGWKSPQELSVAQRMSWAAKRVTTRGEDIAYCLMGLFKVNMPLLYGEGPRAFFRLQQEIIRESSDQSIFAWKAADARLYLAERAEQNRIQDKELATWTSGMLAGSPADFADSGDIVRLNNRSSQSMPYAMTNQGLQITLRLLKDTQPDMFMAFLDCADRTREQTSVQIVLQRDFNTDDQYIRVNPQELFHVSSPTVIKEHQADRSTGEYVSMYIRQQDLAPRRPHPPACWLEEGEPIRVFLRPWTANRLKHSLPASDKFYNIFNDVMEVFPERYGVVAVLSLEASKLSFEDESEDESDDQSQDVSEDESDDQFQDEPQGSSKGGSDGEDEDESSDLGFLVIGLDSRRRVWCKSMPWRGESLERVYADENWPRGDDLNLECTIIGSAYDGRYYGFMRALVDMKPEALITKRLRDAQPGSFASMLKRNDLGELQFMNADWDQCDIKGGVWVTI